MATFWVQSVMQDGRLIGYDIYRMEDTGPEIYESFAGPANVSEADLAEALQLATEYCNDLNRSLCGHCGSRNTAPLEGTTQECHDCGNTYETEEQTT